MASGMRFVHSYWRHEPVLQTLPRLEGRLSADVVVIGGGIVGLSCAFYLKQLGADVMLIEREAIGSQSSTRNLGQLSAVWDFGNAPLDQRRSYARFARSALPALGRLIEAQGIDCEFKSSRFWYLAQSASAAAATRKMAEELEALGFDSGWVEPDNIDVTRSPTHGGVWAAEMTMNPYLLISGLKDALLRMGVRIYEGTETLELRDGDRVEVVTAAGHVKAAKAIIAVNPFASYLGVSQELALPIQTFALATRPLPPEIAEQIGPCDDEITIDYGKRADNTRRFYQRLRPDGSLLFGGGSLVIPAQDELFRIECKAEKISELVTEMKRRYPALSEDDVDVYWGGTLCATVGDKPIIAPVPATKSLILAIVCNGKGMGIGSSAGRIVQQLVAPGSVTDPDALAFLDYCAVKQDIRSRLEGTMFKVLRGGPVRAMANRVFGSKSRT